MKIYLAMIVPDHENSRCLGAFSTLELAKLAFSEQHSEWEFNKHHREWWQVDRWRYGHGYNDNEIWELTLDEPKVTP